MMTLHTQRRAALNNSEDLIGIDYAKFVAAQNGAPAQLILFFIPQTLQLVQKQIIQSITKQHIQLTAADAVTRSRWSVDSIIYPQIDDANQVLIINLKDDSDISTEVSDQNLLTLINVEGIDTFFNQTNFSTQQSSVSLFDCQNNTALIPTTPESNLDIDYLAKDYLSFQQLMLNRLSLLMPQWSQNSPIDIGQMLVDILSYAADQISYYQDAVGTEAYLNTARRRVSVRRHARLLDYKMHEGCNARVWLQFKVNSGNQISLPQGTQLLSKVEGLTGAIKKDSPEYFQALTQSAVAFETMHAITLHAEQNEMQFYTWGEDEYTLTKGSTTATLIGNKNTLNVGDVLLLEEVLGENTGNIEDANPAHRHVVRLTQVTTGYDALYAQAITTIQWQLADALPFCLPIKKND